MGDFRELFNFKNLVKDPTCYKNPDNPSCIDLILTNRQNSCQDTRVIETGLSDFHKLTATVLKTSFKKKPPIKSHQSKATYNYFEKKLTYPSLDVKLLIFPMTSLLALSCISLINMPL